MEKIEKKKTEENHIDGFLIIAKKIRKYFHGKIGGK